MTTTPNHIVLSATDSYSKQDAIENASRTLLLNKKVLSQFK
jgi:hypothetical protein